MKNEKAQLSLNPTEADRILSDWAESHWGARFLAHDEQTGKDIYEMTYNEPQTNYSWTECPDGI